MTKKERQALRDDFVHKKMSEDPNISYEMAIMLFNWNTDHPEDKIKDSLLNKVQKKVKKNRGDVTKLVTVNRITRDKELERILGKDFLRSITKDEYFKGFWRNYVINILKKDKTVAEIRSENYERSHKGCEQPKVSDYNLLKMAKDRYPQFDYLSEEARNEIIEEMKEVIKNDRV